VGPANTMQDMALGPAGTLAAPALPATAYHGWAMKTLGILGAALVLLIGGDDGQCGEITVAPTLVDFGRVSVNGPPAMNVVMITNTGSPTTVNGLTPSGACSSFGATGSFPATLGNGQSMFVDVAFDPATRGSFSCSITVQDGDPNTDSFQLAGVGTAPMLFITSPVYPNPLTFNDQQWDGGVAETLYVGIQNTGNETINQPDFSATLSDGAHFSVGSPEFPIAKGAQALVPVIFDPASEGVKADVLVLLLNNDLPSDPNGLVNLSGTGTNPTTGVDPNFTDRSVGSLSVKTIPSRDGVTVRLELSGEMPVHLAVFDVRGRPVRTLFTGVLTAGTHDLHWDERDQQGRSVGSGLYFVSVQSDGIRRTGRVAIAR